MLTSEGLQDAAESAKSSAEYEQWRKESLAEEITVASEVKIQFNVDPREERGVKTETVWANPVGQGRFRILSNPFFSFGVSADDVVTAEEADGILKFQQVVARGGHSSYRVYLQGDRTIHGPDFRAYWEPISAQGRPSKMLMTVLSP
ncbi:MAG TPA: DUF4265 domain-containing protein [Candidatus Angelobacter sp.]|nr:DUF4265 domain-containing protein [Candidatus Angelobacter sp.]